MTKRQFLAILGAVLAGTTLIGGCSPQYAEEGDAVSVHYTGTLEDGSQFDSSEGGDPLRFTIGASQMIRGFEDAVYGMKVGETKTVTIPSAQAYGAASDEMIYVMERDQFPAGTDLEVGRQITLTAGDGSRFPATVTELTDTTVTLDANHRLAGKDLIFEIKLVEVRKP